MSERPTARVGVRPPTFAGCLRDIAGWLDQGDQAFAWIAQVTGQPDPLADTPRDQIQRDLIKLADRLDKDELLDGLVYSLMTED